ncbi:penicillin-binding transpeptidase domain-containing protein [Pseudohongiella sp.]|uniref:Penicillin-binding protein transpeptidase domain-containing protein n=1 Tax=marine sediment metagenome TaxID=412755 RepID=A0A0F9Z0C8_9ZZZZ|nr:penicillin-binding transpeptidase domain-containing protein [Pseudohongiella sp.]
MNEILTAHPECDRRTLLPTLAAIHVSIALLCSLLLTSRVMAQANAGIEELPYARAAIEATGYQGTMLLYDLNREQYYAANAGNVTQAHIPASTFKIMSSLIAIEAGLVATADTVLPWDGVTRGRTATNADLTLRDAFQLSSVPHYQALVRAVGAPAMQRALSDIAYGNQNISGGIDQFWLTGELRISPAQQISLLRRLHDEQLPFSTDTMQTVKDIMVIESGEDYVLRAKTGLAISEDDRHTGWWVGWVEHDGNVTFFATVLTATAPDSGFIPARLSVTRDVLHELEVLPAATHN